MAIILFASFILLNYLLIFTFAEQLKHRKAIIARILLYFLLLAIAIAVHTWFLDNTLLSPAARLILFRTYISVEISIALSFCNRIFPMLTSQVIAFHIKNNAANLNRHPIKFLIENQDKIILVTSSLILIGAVMAMYGVWFDLK